MQRDLERRVVALETRRADANRPAIAVLAGPDGAHSAAFARYRQDTPSERQANVVVYVRRIGEGA